MKSGESTTVPLRCIRPDHLSSALANAEEVGERAIRVLRAVCGAGV
jgi:hypothetical protein